MQFNLSPFFRRFCHSLCISDELLGSSALLSAVMNHMRSAQQIWPDEGFDQWGAELEVLDAEIRKVIETDTTAESRVDGLPSTKEGKALANTHSLAAAHPEFSALIGKEVCAAMLEGRHINDDFIECFIKISRKAQSMRTLKDLDFLDIQAVNTGLQKFRPSDREHKFLSTCRRLLMTQLDYPQKLHEALKKTQQVQPHVVDERVNERVGSHNKYFHYQHKPETESTAISDRPDISARMKGADKTSISTKFGLSTYDQLHPEDLKYCTKRLTTELKQGDKETRAFASLYLISVCTGFTDFQVINLYLKHQEGESAWLDVDRGCWCWDIRAYRESETLRGAPSEAEVIYCPLPKAVVERLQELKNAFPDSTRLLDLLLPRQVATQDPKKYFLEQGRKFLKRCGPSAHQAKYGRFARSLGSASLFITGSDLHTSLFTGHVELTGSASLYYYHPSGDLAFKRINKLFNWLGMGEAQEVNFPGRVNESMVLPTPEKINGFFASLTAQIEDIKESLSQRPNEQDATRLMALTLTGFVAATGHRASRIDLLTWGACLGSDQFIYLEDKEQASSSSARLLPRTLMVEYFLEAAVFCHAALSPFPPAENKWKRPLFLDLKTGQPLTAHSILNVLTEHFGEGTQANVFRHLWITALDEQECDRWLIRALSGHNRDVTLVSGPYFDIPQVLVCERLKEAQERWFFKTWCSGETNSLLQVVRQTERVHPSTYPVKQVEWAHEARVPDPMTILEPISLQTLAQFEVAKQARVALAEGTHKLSVEARAILSLTFLDLLPDAALALRAVQRTLQLKIYGHVSGLEINRSHSKLPLWFPISPTTEKLIEQSSDGFSPLAVRDEITKFLNSLNPIFWKLKNDIRPLIQSCVLSFTRLTLPPSLAAVAHPSCPAPSLNYSSLLRLAGLQLEIRAESLQRPARLARSRSISESRFDKIFESVREHSSSDNTHGAKQQQARDALLQISKIDPIFEDSHLLESSLSAWVVDELEFSYGMDKHSLALSSLYGYLTKLRQAYQYLKSTKGDGGYLLDIEIEDWSAGNWSDWIDALLAVSPSDALAEHSKTARVRSPVLRMIYSLIRRGFYVPRSVFGKLDESTSTTYFGSTSSCYITEKDIHKVESLAASWYCLSPLDHLLFSTRLMLHANLPMRSSDVSSLKSDCITGSNCLVISPSRIDQIKNESSIRLIHTNRTLADQLRGKIAEIGHSVLDNTGFLFRGAGEIVDARRDVSLANELNIALKTVTADPTARVHSLRSGSMQSQAWPGAESLITSTLRDGLDIERCTQWTQSLHTYWYSVLKASAQSGHTDLRSALGNYLSLWPLVFHAHTQSLLSELKCGVDFMKACGLKRNSYIQHNKRNIKTSDWSWAYNQLKATSTSAICEAHDQVSQKTPLLLNPLVAEPASQISSEKLHMFTTAILLDVKPRFAADKLGVPPKISASLLEQMSTNIHALTVSSRARGAAGERGQKAQRQMLEESLSGANSLPINICTWIHGLESHIKQLLFFVIFERHQLSRSEVWPQMLMSLARDCPAEITILFTRGRKYISTQERFFAERSEGCIRLVDSDEIGHAPLIHLCSSTKPNRVAQARLTAFFKAAVLADHINSLRGL